MEKKWWTLLAVCVGTFMLLLDVTIVVVAIPEIQRERRLFRVRGWSHSRSAAPRT
jgi:hypothetical protein